MKGKFSPVTNIYIYIYTHHPAKRNYDLTVQEICTEVTLQMSYSLKYLKQNIYASNQLTFSTHIRQ